MDPQRLRISPGDDNRNKEDVKLEDFPFKLTLNFCVTIIKRAEKGHFGLGNLYRPEHSV